MTQEIFDSLPDPDMVGTSEYHTIYSHVSDVVDSARFSGDDVTEAVRGTLDELRNELERFTIAFTDFHDPWELPRAHPDAYADWRYEVANGDTLRSFADWYAARSD